MIKIIILCFLFLFNLNAETKTCKDYWNEFKHYQQILIKDNSDCKSFSKVLQSLQNSINQCAKEKTPVVVSGINPQNKLQSLKESYKEMCK